MRLFAEQIRAEALKEFKEKQKKEEEKKDQSGFFSNITGRLTRARAKEESKKNPSPEKPASGFDDFDPEL